jgi:two-component system, cell cycle response regulator CpdR
VSAACVLCVDDEALIRMMVADCIEELGLHPVEAECGEEALELLNRTDIDLLITDIRMCGMSGWEVARRARAKRPDLPVIYISGYPSEGKALEDAIYLAKPFRPRDLQDAVLKKLGCKSGA